MSLSNKFLIHSPRYSEARVGRVIFLSVGSLLSFVY